MAFLIDRPSAMVSLLALLAGCPNGSAEGGSDTDGQEGSGTSSADSSDSSGSSDSQTADSSGGNQGGCAAYEPGGIETEEPMIPADCEDPEEDRCRFDQDHDGVPLFCDNAERVPNPGQSDLDADGLGDAIDLCPLVAGDPNNTSDSDRDGIGNACDSCRQTLSTYNGPLETGAIPFSMWVRNNPYQGDADQDGIGDACDNCPTVPNCGDFGPDNPATLGVEVPYDDPTLCQADTNGNGVGDACEDLVGMGFSGVDDFDGDGLPNETDACPRIPVDTSACGGDSGPCEHADDDGDGIGNACDTCPHVANPEQLVEGSGDDADGDFVGDACEPDEGCRERGNPRAIGFFDVSADGYCCVRTYPGDGVWRTPEGLPIRLDCEDGDDTCAPVAPWVAATPGIIDLSPACDVALELACKEEASAVTLDDVGGDIDQLWSFACRLPQHDVDLDGIGDRCDLCPFAHDPTNDFYVDANGREWPNDGAFCNGDYHPDTVSPDNDCWP